MHRPQCPFMPKTTTEAHRYVEHYASPSYTEDRMIHGVKIHNPDVKFGNDTETTGFHECLGFECAAFIEGRITDEYPIDTCARIPNSNLEELP